MSYTLYPDQLEFKKDIQKKWREPSKRTDTGYKKRLICCAPTGFGKSIVLSDMTKDAIKKNKRVLVITHREELLSQNSGALIGFSLKPDLVTRHSKYPPRSNLVVAMTGTLSRRIKKPEWQEWYKTVDLVILDEAHQQDFNWILIHPLSLNKFILGFTATPERAGKQRQLIDDYEDIVFAPDIQELINLGRLVTDKYFSVPVDMDGVHIKKGEYDTSEMFNKYNKQSLYRGVVDNWNKLWKDTITIVFCVNIQHTINTCKAFNEAGIKAKFIVSQVAKPKPLPDNPTPEDISKHKIKTEEYQNYCTNFNLYSGDRKKVVQQWKDGEYKVLINAGIATTGFDFRPIQTVIINRRTTSRNLLKQMMGRGSRVLNDKETIKYGEKKFFNIGDFGANCEALQCYYRQEENYSLIHETKDSGGGVAIHKECPKCQALVIASSRVCKYCGYVFPKSREDEIVELKEISYKEAVKELNTSKDYELYAKETGKSKNWVFRQIYIKWGKEGLQQYAKEHRYDNSWVYITMARFKAQGIRK